MIAPLWIAPLVPLLVRRLDIAPRHVCSGLAVIRRSLRGDETLQQPKKWWVGLPVLLGVGYLAAQDLTPRIERELEARAAAKLSEMKDAVSDARAGARGRDVAVGGLATSPQERDRALAAVSALDGVRLARDQTDPLKEAKPFVLTLRRDGARVALEGFLPPGETRERLRKALEKLGLEVDDRAGFANGAPPVFAEMTQFAARQLASLDPGLVRLSDAALTLEGDARPGADYQKLLAEAQAAPKGARLERFDVERPSVSPFVFTAKLGAGVLTLQGHAPSKAYEELRALAPKVAPNVAISEGIAPAGGAPKDFAQAAAAGLAALARLDSGELTLTDRSMSLAGHAPAGVEVADRLARALPQGYALTLQIVKPVGEPVAAPPDAIPPAAPDATPWVSPR